MTHTVEEIKQELKNAWKNLREIQKEDRANREVFLEELATEQAAQHNIRLESAIKQIQNAEASCDSHKKLNQGIRKSSKGAIDHVLIPDGDDPNGPFGEKWKQITNIKEVEKILLERNENKLKESKMSLFSASSNTSITNK